MFDTTQPFTNFANANMAAFSRLMQSSGVPDLAHAHPYLKGAGGSWAGPAGTSALVEWSQAVAQNYATFLNEWTRSVSSVFWQGQSFMTGQTKEMSRDFLQGLDAIARAEEEAVDAINVEADSVVSLESARQRKKAK